MLQMNFLCFIFSEKLSYTFTSLKIKNGLYLQIPLQVGYNHELTWKLLGFIIVYSYEEETVAAGFHQMFVYCCE